MNPMIRNMIEQFLIQKVTEYRAKHADEARAAADKYMRDNNLDPAEGVMVGVALNPFSGKPIPFRVPREVVEMLGNIVEGRVPNSHGGFDSTPRATTIRYPFSNN